MNEAESLVDSQSIDFEVNCVDDTGYLASIVIRDLGE